MIWLLFLYLFIMKSLLFIILLLPMTSFSQDLDKHLWKDRLLLVIGDSYQNPNLINQLQELNNNKQDLKERKLIVYQIIRTSFQQGIQKNTSTKKSAVYKRYNPFNEDFKIILIGLDGNIKLKSNKVLSPSQIFDKIDKMPMRKLELRTKN